MEEMYWKQFWETGKIMDYLDYRDCLGNRGSKIDSAGRRNPESGDTIESDYSDRDGFTGITYR